MIIANPRFVVLDTATINHAAANSANAQVKELLSMFQSGDWITFITYHHLEEIACHANDDVFKRRFQFLGSLPHITYLRKPTEEENVGDSLYLRDYEIQFLAAHPDATHQEVIEAVRPKVRSGFYSGKQFLNENLGWWEFFHENLATKARRDKAEIANLTHFPITNMIPKMKKRIPAKGKSGKTCSEEEAAARFEKMGRWLEHQIRENGDCREINPGSAAISLMRETFEETRQDWSAGGNLFDAFMTRYGVKRDRLPVNPCTEDVGYEAIFVGQMGIHARRLLKNKEELLCLVRKEQVPSWFVWQELDRRIKQLQKAENGNINDKHSAAFGLYVDMLNVDKRIADLLRQAGRHHELLLQVSKRVPEKRGFSGLLDALKA